MCKESSSRREISRLGVDMKIVLLLSIVALASANLQLKDEWEAWKREHGKAYADELEESLRHAIWFQNYHYIGEHNKRESFKLSLNEFADLVRSVVVNAIYYLISSPYPDKAAVHSEVS